MGLRLLGSSMLDEIGPDTVSGSGHENPFGMRFTTYRPNVTLTTCIIKGAIGSYTVKLYRIVGSTPSLIDSMVVSILTANTDTLVTLNLTAPTAGDYYVGFDASHSSLFRSDDMGASFPFTITDVISVVHGVQFNNWTNIFNRWYYFYDLQIEYGYYEESGQAIYGPYSLPAVSAFRESGISWAETVPEDTTLTVYAGLADPGETPSTWEACTSGSALPTVTPGKDLYIKVIMTTTDDTITPELSGLSFWYEGNDNHEVVRLHLTYTGRLKHPQGDVAVGYAASSGNLKNAAGTLSVATFEQTLDPDEVDLILFFNPHDAENIEASVDLDVAVNKVAYNDRKSAAENIQASIDLSVAVYDTSNNPV